MIGFLILLHELGHFLAAQWVKIPVARFSIGFGPKLWGCKRQNTEYWLSWIPIGGYVLPEIENQAEFFRFPIYKRIIFATGGPLVNLVLPLLFFIILNVMESGFSLAGVLTKPFAQTFVLLYKMLETIPLLFSEPGQLSGIVGIVAQGGQFVGTDVIRALNYAILLSLNLAILNLLPFPPLDGGKIILYLLEKVHPKLLRIHIPLAITGWLLLIGLMVYVTVLDLGRIFGKLIQT
ncbi:site-2 protease family protein [Candidatus Poribacteria bacterium]|nr:site-2 protease family protein [Candidatus Poribacteria bacterium]